MPWNVDIEGSSITRYSQSINWHPRWSRPATLVVKCPGHLFQAYVGQEIHLYNPSGGLVFSGPIWQIQKEGGPNRTDIEITAFDHLIYMVKRQCKQDPTGPQPYHLIDIWPTIYNFGSAPAIMAAFVQGALSDPNAASSKPLPWTIGSVDGGPDVTSVPKDTPMTLDRMRQLLLSTGQLAINVSPGIGSSTLNFIRPPNGVDVPIPAPVASFAYQTGSFNSQNATVTDDMDEMTTALWYFLGPRGPRPGIPINHWGGSITPTAANGGPDGDGPAPGTPWPANTVNRFMTSRGQYGYFQDVRVFDDNDDTQSIRLFYEEEWNNEAFIRAVPRKFFSIKPERGIVPTFNVGDFISQAAGSRLNGGDSGTVQVFEFEVEINVNGVCTITDIIASDNGSGAGSVN